jgi:hypothetical protein
MSAVLTESGPSAVITLKVESGSLSPTLIVILSPPEALDLRWEHYR